MTTSPVMHLLHSGVPLTLLLDLWPDAGPDSVAINATERPLTDPVWRDAAADRRRERGLRSAG